MVPRPETPHTPSTMARVDGSEYTCIVCWMTANLRAASQGEHEGKWKYGPPRDALRLAAALAAPAERAQRLHGVTIRSGRVRAGQRRESCFRAEAQPLRGRAGAALNAAKHARCLSSRRAACALPKRCPEGCMCRRAPDAHANSAESLTTYR